MFTTTLMEFFKDEGLYSGLKEVTLPRMPHIGEVIDTNINEIGYVFYIKEIGYGDGVEDIDLRCIRLGTTTEYFSNHMKRGWVERRIEEVLYK